MSDRLPPRRRSGGGKHVATGRTRQPLTGLAHAGVATAMVAGLVLVVVNPAVSDTAAANPSSDTATVTGPADHAAWLVVQQDWLAERDATREDLAGVATQAVAQVADVKAKAQQANLPADQIAAIDTLRQQVDQLVAQVHDSTIVRVSRSGGRLLDEAAPASGEAAAQPTESSSPSASARAAAPDPAASSSATSSAPSVAVSSDASASSAEATATPDPAATDAEIPAAADPAADATPPDVTDPAALDVVLPAVTTADDPTAAALRVAVLALSQQVAQVDAAADVAAAQAAADTAAQKAAEKVSLEKYANGKVPASALCALSFAPAALLRCDAADAMEQLDAAYRAAFGADLTITDSYRSYAAQVACRRTKGYLCAVPGTSNHGLGVAVDFGGSAHTFGTAAHTWLEAHAAEFGWHLPGWAQAGGSKPEPWHWEYAG